MKNVEERAVREALERDVRERKAATEHWPEQVKGLWKYALPRRSCLKMSVPHRSCLKKLASGELARKVSWAKPHDAAWPTEMFPIVRVTDPEHGELFHTQAWCKLQLGLARSGVMVDPPTGRV